MVEISTWSRCYDSRWNGLIVPEAYAHPAKFSRSLIQKIYQHCAAEGWLAPGATVLDCFAGTGLGGLDAGLAGYRFIGVELEARFCALAHGFDCGGSAAKHEACPQQGDHEAHHVTGNLELWNRRYSHLPQWVAPTLLQGDSRALGEILREQVECCVSSTPFQQSLQASAGINLARRRHVAALLGIPQREVSPLDIAEPAQTSYGTSPAQLGNLPAGTVECAISSPPYEASVTTGHAPEKDIARAVAAGHTLASMGNPGGQLRYAFEYGADPAQLGNEHGTTFWEASKQILEQVVALLKPNRVAVFVVKAYVRDGAIVDFPGQWRTLAESCGLTTLHEHHALLVEDHGTQGGLFGEDTVHQTHKKSFFRRLHEKKRPDLAINFEVVLCMQKTLDTAPGSVDLCCSSPPYAASAVSDLPRSNADGGGGGIGKQFREGKRPVNARKKLDGTLTESYGHTEGQLGAMPAGPAPAQE